MFKYHNKFYSLFQEVSTYFPDDWEQMVDDLFDEAKIDATNIGNSDTRMVISALNDSILNCFLNRRGEFSNNEMEYLMNIRKYVAKKVNIL